MLNSLENDLLNKWREVCDENHALTQEYLNLRWFDLFNFSKMKDLNTRREVAHQKWMLLFNLLTTHKILQANNLNLLNQQIVVLPTKDYWS